VAAPAALTDERLRNVVREEVDAALAARLSPLTRMLASRQREEGVRLTDVIGGIGYILGLAGLYAYFAGRRRPQAKG
jgi:nickel transport protein